MKIKTGTIVWLIVGFIWSIFMGITAVSMGIGSLFPNLNEVAAPFVCPNGKLEVRSNNYEVSPVETVTTLHYYCVDGRTGAKTELNPFSSINLYAGAIYGLLIFLAVLVIWYFYSRWDPSRETAESKKQAAWIQAGIVIVIVVGVTLFNVMPFFRSPTATSEPASTPGAMPDATATSLALSFQSLTSGRPAEFNSTDKPLANWNDIPIMSQAAAGQQVDDNTYKFRVPVDSGTIESFYTDALKSSGWSLEHSQFLGMEYTKDKSTLLVAYTPEVDLQSYVVTLVLVK